MFNIKYLLVLTFTAPVLACQGIVEKARPQMDALNNFWGTNIPICHLSPGNNNAFADRTNNTVLVDQSWLDNLESQYGGWAASGVLAHEWGHMVQGNVSGTAAELQADCLAGVFFKGQRLSWQAAEQFAYANFFAGDKEWSYGGHGTGQQRMMAVRRGYYGFNGQPPHLLPALCPLSAF